MSAKAKAAEKDAGPPTVTLVHPDGREYEASTPTELNDLVTGYGYTIKGGEDLTTATARLAPAVEDGAAATTTGQAETGGPSS